MGACTSQQQGEVHKCKDLGASEYWWNVISEAETKSTASEGDGLSGRAWLTAS